MVVSFHTIDIEPSSDVVFFRTRQTEFNRKKNYDGKMPISANSLDQKPMHKHVAGIEHKLNFIIWTNLVSGTDTCKVYVTISYNAGQ